MAAQPHSRRLSRVSRRCPLSGSLTFHECRHTYASALIDAGENAKAIQTIMGHSKIQVTFDVYGHLLPGSMDEVRERMDAYFERGPSAVQTTPSPSGSERS